MKKIIFLILMIIPIILLNITSVKAYDDGYYIDTEEYMLTTDEIVTVNSNTTNNRMIPLNDNYVNNHIELDLTNVYSNFVNYAENTDKIRSIYFYFYFQFPIGVNWNGMWLYDDQNIVTISNYIIKYSYDNNDNISLDLKWSGSTDSLLLDKIIMYVEYDDSIIDEIDVISDYSLLPDNVDSYNLITDFEKYDDLTNSYHLSFEKYIEEINTTKIYTFDVALPEDVNLTNYVKENGDINVSYTTLESGDRVIYLQSNLELDPFPTTQEQLEINNDLDGFMLVNLSQQETQQFKLLILDSIINKEGDFNAFMYAFYDITIEEILVMSVNYDYRLNYFGLFSSEWINKTDTYNLGETEDTILWWHYFLPFIDSFGTTIQEKIVPITKTDVPEDVLSIYYDDFNKTESDIDNLNLYKIHLDQFSGGDYTAFNTGYDITKFAVIKLIYKYDGIIYQASERQLEEQDNVTPETTVTVTDFISIQIDRTENNVKMLVGSFVLVAFILLTNKGIKLIKKKKN